MVGIQSGSRAYQQKFRIRAQFAGTLTWTCPKCGGVNRDRLTPGQVRIKCSKPGCARKLMVGLNFHNIAPGQGTQVCPPDTAIGAETMPECEIVDTWRTTQPVHRLKED
jgi:hypothetical protein